MTDMLACAKFRYDYVRLVTYNIYMVPVCRVVPLEGLDKYFEEGLSVSSRKYYDDFVAVNHF